jgi:multiple antibiotic resistance protein
VLLLLSGIEIVHTKTGTSSPASDGDVAVVPLAMPIIVGPATTGTLLVMGAELNTLSAKIIGCLSLLSAVTCMAGVLLAGSLIQRYLRTKGIAILSKLTGLVLTALAAQMIMTGIQGFLGISR